MNFVRSFFFVGCLSVIVASPVKLLADSPATAAPAANKITLPALTEAETAAGWRLLFDGRSLDGWRSLKTETPPVGWEVIDGNLVRTAKGGDLVTVDDFGDFELVLEWKVTGAANSGIMYRVGLTEGAVFRTGPEYQVLDNLAAKDRFNPTHRAGALYDLIAPANDATKPVGEWNTARIVVRGWRVEHWLNDVKLLETDLAGPEGKALIAGSKFKTMPKFATLARGHISLQDHGDIVSFRHIRIRELK
jgi:Domain of Unknown Function (DUF1080)